ncbi:competence protein ComF [Sulfitobacter donghicola DSW-25 = KCTC 12864 = JCM 14565]|uniref:Competence protein ComF n=2 Tax=Sulfitobacter TaxID=60136 RepID=A0A073IMF2_9RHOB|nr:competence protein ComF [Sulfitobacter donghicola DSW-25 = KCTC 12864 = JCM 14565]
MAQLQTAVSMIYPPRCTTCGDLVESDFGLCGPCWRETAFLGGAICDACGVPLTSGGKDGVFHCDTCMQDPPPWVQGRAAVIYRGNGRKLVLALKHGDRQELARPAGVWMANMVRNLVSKDTLVVPVPLHWSRLLRRRYNQSALLGAEVAKNLGVSFCPDALLRRVRTPSLEGLSHEARMVALEKAITPHPKRGHRLDGKPILLVDDVMTSGATLKACTNACFDAGSGPVRILTLARAVKEA